MKKTLLTLMNLCLILFLWAFGKSEVQAAGGIAAGADEFYGEALEETQENTDTDVTGEGADNIDGEEVPLEVTFTRLVCAGYGGDYELNSQDELLQEDVEIVQGGSIAGNHLIFDDNSFQVNYLLTNEMRERELHTIMYVPEPTYITVDTTNKGIEVSLGIPVHFQHYKVNVYRKVAHEKYEIIKEFDSESEDFPFQSGYGSFVDATAESGLSYRYAADITAVDVADDQREEGAATSNIMAYGPYVTVLSTPVLETVTATYTGVSLKWKSCISAKGYYVYRKTGKNGSWAKVGTVEGEKTTTFVDTKAENWKSYYYTVRAYSDTSISPYMITGKNVIYLKAPAISSVAPTTAGAKVTWSKNTMAQGYYVFRKTGTGSWVKIANIKSGSTVTYTDKTAASGKTYYYTVRAYRNGYFSSYNKTGKSILYLKTPTTKVTAGSKKVTVSWNKSAGASSYIIYRRLSGGGWSKLTTIKSGSTVKYVDKSAKSGKKYYYAVRAAKGNVGSAYASSQKVIPK